jgi:hypothetical protein
MKRWVLAALMILCIGALSSGFIMARRSQLPTVTLEPGFELRLTKVALGERTIEPWENLPRKLASYLIPSKFKEKTDTPTARSLEIHLGKFDTVRGQFVAAKFNSPVVFFPNGRSNGGILMNARSNVVRAEFSSYPRNEEQIQIQLGDGERKIAFSIPNPHRSEKQKWRSAPLPQTNSTGKINVMLQDRGDPEVPFFLTSHSGTGEPQAWTQWNIELHDAYGNWTRLRNNGRRVSRTDCPLLGDCFKLVARGKEYISAGMVNVPTTNGIIRLKPTSRAVELGLQTAFLIGPGTYQLNGIEPRVEVGQISKTNSVVLIEDIFEVRTTLPSILLVRQKNLPFLESMSARLRERPKDERQSKYFHSRKEIAATNDNTGIVANLLPLVVFTTEPQLEAEIIAAHRAAEFFVPAKTSGPAK